MQRLKLIIIFFFITISHTAFSQSQVTDSLKKILAQQDSMISAFKEIKEDILADKVFQKSKSKLNDWITFGGLFVLLAAIFGFWKLSDFVKANVKSKIGKISQEQVLRQIKKQSDEYVEKLITQKVSALNLSQIADQIKEEGQNELKEMVKQGKGEFDDFVASKKDEIEALVIQLKQSIENLNNPIGAHEKEKKIKLIATEENIASQLDYSKDMLPVRNSASEGSVVGFAIAYAVEYQIFKQDQKQIRISPRQIYYYSRINSGMDIKQDSGAFIRGGIKSVREIGAIDEKEWPYKAGEFNKKPPATEKDAMHYKITETTPIKNLKEIKNSIKLNGPVVIGISVFESLYSNDEANKNGVFQLPKEKEAIFGAIAICIVGYDDHTKLFKFINCWGKNWGDKGFGYVPYEYIRKYSEDGWSLNGVSV